MQREFMARAIELSGIQMRTRRGGPFGAVIVKGGEIISEGYNEVIAGNDPTAHAEVMAIRKAGSRLRAFHLAGCEIYASCEPCPMCLAAIYQARIEKIYFANTAADARDIGFDDDLVYGELQLPRSERRIPYRQLLRDEALAVFREWRNTADRPENQDNRGHGRSEVANVAPQVGSQRERRVWL